MNSLTNKSPGSLDHILYVEDEDLNWEIAELSLRKKYKLTRARDAKEAFAMLAAHDFACVLMDIQLQGSEFDGIQITQIVKGKYGGIPPAYARNVRQPHVAIIFVTAYAGRYSKADLIEAGGADMIAKPVNFTGLSLAITRVVSRAVLDKLQPEKLTAS